MAVDNIALLDRLRRKLDDTDEDPLEGILHFMIQLPMGAGADALCGPDHRKRIRSGSIPGTATGPGKLLTRGWEHLIC